MNNMNGYPGEPQDQHLTKVFHNGNWHLYNTVDNTLDPRPVDPPSADYDQDAAYATADYEPVAEEQTNEVRRKRRIPTKLLVGGLALGIILPSSAHAGAEWVTNEVINRVNPQPDKTITMDQYLEDIGVSLNKMTGGQNG